MWTDKGSSSLSTPVAEEKKMVVEEKEEVKEAAAIDDDHANLIMMTEKARAAAAAEEKNMVEEQRLEIKEKKEREVCWTPQLSLPWQQLTPPLLPLCWVKEVFISGQHTR